MSLVLSSSRENILADKGACLNVTFQKNFTNVEVGSRSLQSTVEVFTECCGPPCWLHKKPLCKRNAAAVLPLNSRWHPCVITVVCFPSYDDAAQTFTCYVNTYTVFMTFDFSYLLLVNILLLFLKGN